MSTSKTVNVPLFPEDRPQDLDALSSFYQAMFEGGRDDDASSSPTDSDTSQATSSGGSVSSDDEEDRPDVCGLSKSNAANTKKGPRVHWTEYCTVRG